MIEPVVHATAAEAAEVVDRAIEALQSMRYALKERSEYLEQARKLAPQLVVFPDDAWRLASDTKGFPTEGKVWVSDGERVWDIWARGGISPGATACKFWLDGYQWPAPPSAERVSALSTSP
jgi:hypothetical protein